MTEVPSPCTQRCHLDEATGSCTGCGRTMAEIQAWPYLTDEEKRQVLSRLPEPA